MLRAPTYADVLAAADRLRGVAHQTPVFTSRNADERAGASVFFKCENFQRMGAFKFRGAYNAIAQFDAAQKRAGVLTYSSGNHAQAIALSARLLGVGATIIMPKDAPRAKVEATQGYGGEVIFYDRYTESREAIGEALARERGMTLIPPYDHPHVIAGQGTAAKELIEEVGALDALVVCLGGGGLTAGSALANATVNPGGIVIGVEPEAGNDVQRSLALGRIVRIAVPRTIADGAASTHVGEFNFAVLRELAVRVVTVSDAALVEAMCFFAERMKMVVEPTGCLAAAAVLGRAMPELLGKRIGIIVSGGNVDLERFASLVGGAATSAG